LPCERKRTEIGGENIEICLNECAKFTVIKPLVSAMMNIGDVMTALQVFRVPKNARLYDFSKRVRLFTVVKAIGFVAQACEVSPYDFHQERHANFNRNGKQNSGIGRAKSMNVRKHNIRISDMF
jgi:hypothetical protein